MLDQKKRSRRNLLLDAAVAVVVATLSNSIVTPSPVVQALHDNHLNRPWGTNSNRPGRLFFQKKQHTNKDGLEVLRQDKEGRLSVPIHPSPPLRRDNALFSSHRNVKNMDSHGSARHDDQYVRKAPKIIILGGPASGKGTQCELIAAKYGVVHLSTGDLLRQAVKQDTSVGILAKTYMDRGELVPDDVIIQIVNDRIRQHDCDERGYLLDGFPRTAAQAEHLTKSGITADVVLLLSVPDEEMIKRVVGRRTDPVTGIIYHLEFKPPPAEIVHRLEQRSDDTVEKIERRLQQFHENLSQVRSYFKDSIIEIDGSCSADEVSQQVGEAIESKLFALLDDSPKEEAERKSKKQKKREHYYQGQGNHPHSTRVHAS